MKFGFVNVIKTSVGLKFFTIITIFILIISSSFIFFFFTLQKKALTDMLSKNGSLLTNVLASNSKIGIFSESKNVLNDVVEGIIKQENVIAVEIFNRKRRLLKSVKGSDSYNKFVNTDKEDESKIIDKLLVDTKNFWLEYPEYLDFWAPVFIRAAYVDEMALLFDDTASSLPKDRIIGFVKLTVDKRKLNRSLIDLLIKSVLIGVTFLLSSICVLFLAIRRIIGPLNRLTRSVKTFGEKGIFGKVSVETMDEIGKLANTFNVVSEVLQKRDHELRESEEKYRLIVENTVDVIMIIEPNDNVSYISPACRKLFGYEPDYFINSQFSIIHHEDIEHVKKARLLFSKEETIPHFECRIKTKTGEIKWTSQTWSQVAINDNSRHIICVIRDITQEKNLRKEADYRLQQVIQVDKLASLGEVVAGVAHEINNPNSFISYNIPILEETWEFIEPIINEYAAKHPNLKKNNIGLIELGEDMREIIEALKIGSKRINNVITNLKDFARLDQSHHLEPVQMNNVVKHALTIAGNQLKKAVASIDVQYGNNIPEIKGHFQKLEQVIVNLLVNAAKSILRKETGKLVISTRYIESQQLVLFEVEDNGVGIPPKDLQRIFEPFYTTRRNVGGTGLGLSVSYGLIQEHGGIINVLSQPDKGSRFNVYLPVNPKVALNFRPVILCIDNDELFLDRLVEFLTDSEKLDTAVTHTLEESVSYLQDHPEVDIILLSAKIYYDNIINRRGLYEIIKERYRLVKIILYMDCDKMVDRDIAACEPDYILPNTFTLNDIFETIITSGRQRI